MISRCTSGFAVLRSNGEGRLLSASHCDTTGNAPVTDGANHSIAPGGTSVSRSPHIDSLLIDPSASPATTPKIYRGEWNGTTSSVVKSWANSFLGDELCTSGATTGGHCGEVYRTTMTFSYEGYDVPVVQVGSSSWLMAGSGDSGGPVFSKLSNGVQARGIVMGADETDGDMDRPLNHEECQDENLADDFDPATDVLCTRFINVVRIGDILNGWYDGLTLETG